MDSVAFVMEIEKRFDMRFEDDRMSAIHTVEQVAEEVCRILDVMANRSGEREQVASVVRRAMPGRSEEEPIDLPLSAGMFDELTRSLEASGCLLPDLGPFRSVRILFIMQDPGGTLESPSIGQFIDRIVAHNHHVLIPEKVPASRYAAMMVVLGIVADNAGVPIMRIALGDSLTNDLGMD
ncbi:MAG: hypothetical protein JNM62_06915 [Flavobacteriales bacterium]|nr:hypothetical protein [Flavobacteriales bacterium]